MASAAVEAVGGIAEPDIEGKGIQERRTSCDLYFCQKKPRATGTFCRLRCEIYQKWPGLVQELLNPHARPRMTPDSDVGGGNRITYRNWCSVVRRVGQRGRRLEEVRRWKRRCPIHSALYRVGSVGAWTRRGDSISCSWSRISRVSSALVLNAGVCKETRVVRLNARRWRACYDTSSGE